MMRNALFYKLHKYLVNKWILYVKTNEQMYYLINLLNSRCLTLTKHAIIENSNL